MRQKALRLLDQLTRESLKREERSTDLLRAPDTGSETDWHLHVPPCFNDALDIRQTSRKADGKTLTVWTQGSAFAFKAGDILYDTPKAYADWAQSLQHINVSVQVKSASSATNSQAAVARNPGTVEFDVLVPSPDKARLVHSASYVVTQDKFLRFLISGEGLE